MPEEKRPRVDRLTGLATLKIKEKAMNKKQLFFTVLCSISALALIRCGSSNSGSDGTGSEVATAAIGGSASTSEATIAFRWDAHRPTFMERIGRALDPIPKAWAIPACDWASIISSCASNAETLSFNGCSAPSDHAISISGSETLSWTGASCCTSAPLSASSSTPCSFTRRTITSSGTADPMIRSVGANAVTMNTEDSSGYSQKKSGGFTVTCQGSNGTNTCDAQRQITIQGAHYTGQSGRAQWDHTVSTDVPLVVQGDGGSRVVLSGTVRVQHNLTNMTSISTITKTLTHTAGCCYPTGGEITTTFSGGAYDGKTETMTFGPGCGEATLNNTSQQQTGLTLHHCL